MLKSVSPPWTVYVCGVGVGGRVGVAVGTLLASTAATSKVGVGAAERGRGPRPQIHRMTVTVRAETITLRIR
jgi:hypothetical protein